MPIERMTLRRRRVDDDPPRGRARSISPSPNKLSILHLKINYIDRSIDLTDTERMYFQFSTVQFHRRDRYDGLAISDVLVPGSDVR